MVDLKINLPESFYKEEARNGYTISSEMKKVWAVELDMLVEFDRICKILNIKYFLDSGTLLGAVRHRGFIPWDDDIDVIMLREDYDILIHSGSSFFKYPYFLQCAYTDKDYFRGHAQMRNSATSGILPQEGKKISYNQGIFMDIFVLDGIPENKGDLAEQIDDQNKLWQIYYKTFLPYHKGDSYIKSKLKEARALLLRTKNRNCVELFGRFEKVTERFEDSNYVDKICLRTDPGQVHYLKREWFSNVEEYSFESFSFYGPQNAHEILCEYYGPTYMTPKKENTYHGTVVFNTDLPYKEFLKRKF